MACLGTPTFCCSTPALGWTSSTTASAAGAAAFVCGGIECDADDVRVVDLAEEQMGDGGGDLCLENKVYIDLVPVGTSPAPDTSLRGATHGFGNTEERLIRMNFGRSTIVTILIKKNLNLICLNQ